MNTVHRRLKLPVLILNIIMEGTMSQFFYRPKLICDPLCENQPYARGA